MESGELEQFVLSDELSEIQDDSMLGMGPPLSPTQLLHGLWESPAYEEIPGAIPTLINSRYITSSNFRLFSKLLNKVFKDLSCYIFVTVKTLLFPPRLKWRQMRFLIASCYRQYRVGQCWVQVMKGKQTIP